MSMGRHHPVDWENPEHPLAKKEPRHGRRLTLAATVKSPSGPLVVYSCHLEVSFFWNELASVKSTLWSQWQRKAWQGFCI